MINLGVQVCPEVRSESVQFRPPTRSGYSQTAPSQNPSKLTQTVTLTPAGSHAVAVQTMRTVVVSKGCGQGDVITKAKDIGSQTIMVSKAAFLKPGRMKRDDTVLTARTPMKNSAAELDRTIVKTEKADDISTPQNNRAGSDRIGEMTSTVKSDSPLHNLFECIDDTADSVASPLKAKHKGILKGNNFYSRLGDFTVTVYMDQV